MVQSEEYIKKLLNNEIIEFKEKTLVLASKSASRIKVLERAGLKFVAIPSLIDEEKLKTEFGEVKAEEVAANYVKRLSHEKAMWVYEHVKNAVVIGADTVAFYKDEILEKPKDEADARRIFTTLSNSTHTVLTGVCIVDDKKVDNFVKVSPIKKRTSPTTWRSARSPWRTLYQKPRLSSLWRKRLWIPMTSSSSEEVSTIGLAWSVPSN